MKCRECGYEFSNDAKFCPDCGKAVQYGSNTIKCRKCGYDVESKLKYCPQCGESVSKDYKGDKTDKRDRRGRDRGGDDDDDEGGILGGIGDFVGKIFGG